MSAITVCLDGSETLIEQLKKKDIPVFECCGQGICGSCRATLKSGSVQYVDEPLACLDDDEIVLCCAKPTSPSVVIEL